MAENKKSKAISKSLLPPGRKPKGGSESQKPSSSAKKAPAKSSSPSGKKKAASAAEVKARKKFDENSMLFQLTPYILAFFGIIVAISLIIPEKLNILVNFAFLLRGLFSYAAWTVPFFIINQSIFWKKDALSGNLKYKTVFSVICLLLTSAIVTLCFIKFGSSSEYSDIFGNFKEYYSDAKNYLNGGIIGGIIGISLFKFAGSASIAIAAFIIVILGLFLFGTTPADAYLFVKNKLREFAYDVKNHQKQTSFTEEYEQTEEESLPVPEEQYPKKKGALNSKNIDIDTPNYNNSDKKSIFENLDDDINEMLPDDKIFDKAQQNHEEALISENFKDSKVITSVSDVNSDKVNLDEIFANDAVIAAGGISMDKSVLSGTPANALLKSDTGGEQFGTKSEEININPKPSPEELYTFPPVSFLASDPNPATFKVTDNLKATSLKLVDTLANFGVKTKITNISCGPTVTRYELQPEVGVRVRAIQNLADDIALHLAASGVRIEAPIPGKDAVGIEIPNKHVSTVYIKNLIENPQFKNLKSKLSVCLGMDVAGNPVYMDIAKMPHLLIAGATGMGKSVCINSFIVSMLYKARPDEVKLILIDPKKVELGIYNGIPHLLVPVVNNPKNAAGTLSWAVNEMERRFALIEEVNVRNLTDYNKVTKNDPEKEYMPQIVIIIDELADLMMTAKDEVENSICRLAQKARAAGMHLVIGTQRPSVDVITGLIKANVPSRIAFTVASQVDSRTIIDISGAEKLVGRGDMLFAPVGSMKPMRVQGSFVSETEVEEIAEFLKKQMRGDYNKDIIEQIEKETVKCGEKKKRSSDFDSKFSSDDASEDEMIMPAIGIAVETGQISTSLLQRKLSLGYARAARIIDMLETKGFIGPFEGSKPRKVLITKEEYFELKLKNAEPSSDE